MEDIGVLLLLVHGTADRLTSPKGTQFFAHRAPNCTLKLWDGLYHEAHNEPERDEILAFPVNWLLSGIKV